MRSASIAIALSFLASSLALRPALAATSTSSFAVTATVQSACQASAPASAFGNHPSGGSSPVSVACTLPTAFDVSLSPNLATSATRKTIYPAKTLLSYVLAQGSAGPFDRGKTAGTGILAGTGHQSSNLQAAYSQTYWTQEVASGAFADAVTVTITY
jgi:spore coat protein U-like protein